MIVHSKVPATEPTPIHDELACEFIARAEGWSE